MLVMDVKDIPQKRDMFYNTFYVNDVTGREAFP